MFFDVLGIIELFVKAAKYFKLVARSQVPGAVMQGNQFIFTKYTPRCL